MKDLHYQKSLKIRKVVMTSRKSMDRQRNGQKKKGNDLQNTAQTN
jgi:hypothetical protein